jgi:hypothetical protein
MENEPGLQWNRDMRELLREMIHFRNSLDPLDLRNPDQIDPATVLSLEKRYDDLLMLAQEEYEDGPPSGYYKDGYNLFLKMQRYRDNHLLFLHDRRVPHTNNLSERLLRVFKRKQHQVMTFRSYEGLENLCTSLGAIAMKRLQGFSLLEAVAQVYAKHL